ncbi:MAG: serine protease, partial [Bdellovibrionales bacterium]|nr:serine protease [Bdellovibrionales bacterium]
YLLATLSYYDAPGLVGAAQALVNDLDLEVEGVRNRRGAKSDRVNNTEMIEAKVTPGTYKITVRGVNVPMGSSRGNRQSFAVVLGR